MISVERSEEIKMLLKNIEDLNQTINERNLEIKQQEHSINTLLQEKKTLKYELKFTIEARDSNANKIKELKIELAEHDSKTEIVRLDNAKLKEKITLLEIDRMKLGKDLTGMKLQLEEQQEKNIMLQKKMQEDGLALKFSSQSLKQEQQENAKLVEQNKTLEEDSIRKQQSIDEFERVNVFLQDRLAKSEQHRMFIAIRLSFMIRFGRAFTAIFQSMIEEKQTEYDTLYGKYSKILPKFNKITQEHSLLQTAEKKLRTDLE